MDTQVTNRRSIPTELKPRLRYAGGTLTQDRYVWYYYRHMTAPTEAINVVRNLFGKAYTGRVGFVFFVRIPLELQD